METFCNNPKCEMTKMGIPHNTFEHFKISRLKEIESQGREKIILLIFGFLAGIGIIFYLNSTPEIEIDVLVSIVAVVGWICFEIWGAID